MNDFITHLVKMWPCDLVKMWQMANDCNFSYNNTLLSCKKSTDMKLLTRIGKLLRLATDNNFTFDTHTLNICTMADKKSKT